MHQEFTVEKTKQLKEEGKEKVLWGHIQRSGKSYIIAGTIIEDSKYKDKSQPNSGVAVKVIGILAFP